MPEDAYITALIEDFTIQAPRLQGRSIQTIFIGGGTPSLFSGASYERLLNALQKKACFSNAIEITLEANPGTVEQKRFKDYRKAGINRLSIGVQSFNNAHLKTLERIHDSNSALHAIDMAHNAGFDELNIDLMFGLPGQSLNEGLSDLEIAIACRPTHLSWYQLTLEPNTFFYHSPPKLPDDESIWKLEEEGRELLASHQYHRYEISAYAYDTHACRHNLNYWNFGDYLGIGAGAHSKVTDLHTNEITRFWNIKNPKEYLNPSRAFVSNQHTLQHAEKILEFMMNALRLTNSVSFSDFTERTGLPITALHPGIDNAFEQGFLTLNNESLSVTSHGHRFLNDLLALF